MEGRREEDGSEGVGVEGTCTVSLSLTRVSPLPTALWPCPPQAAIAPGEPPRPPELAVSVRHLPMHLCALDPSTFTLPVAGAAAMLARQGDLSGGALMDSALMLGDSSVMGGALRDSALMLGDSSER